MERSEGHVKRPREHDARGAAQGRVVVEIREYDAWPPARVGEGLAANVGLDRGSQCLATGNRLTVHDEQPDAEDLLQVRDPDADVRRVVLEQLRGGWVLRCKR